MIIPEGKICIPLSGGLDSRYVAGAVSRKRKIDLAYTQYVYGYDQSFDEVTIARRVAEICGIKNHYVIFVSPEDMKRDEAIVKTLPQANALLKSGMYSGLRRLNEMVNLKEYTFLVPYGLDVLTGINVNPLTLFTWRKKDKYYLNVKHDLNEQVLRDIWGKFGKDAINPIWDWRVNLWMALPWRYRFHQRHFRYIIKTVYPELAALPRAGMDCPMDVGGWRYFYERIKYWLKK